MVQIKKKSFFGQIIGVVMIIVMIWIKDEFKLTTGQSVLIGFISLFVILILGYFLMNYQSDNLTDGEILENLETELRKLTNPIEKKNLILKESKKIKFGYYNIRSLITFSKIEDDEFWISFFIENIKESPQNKYDIGDLYEFIYHLNSENSINKLKSLLLSKGFQIENEKIESHSQWMREYRLRKK